MSPLVAIVFLNTVLSTLQTVLLFLAAIPGAEVAVAPIQLAITSISSALGVLGSLPIPIASNFR